VKGATAVIWRNFCFENGLGRFIISFRPKRGTQSSHAGEQRRHGAPTQTVFALVGKNGQDLLRHGRGSLNRKEPSFVTPVVIILKTRFYDLISGWRSPGMAGGAFFVLLS